MSEKHRLQAQAAGQTGWGRVGSSEDHLRYMYLLPGRYRNRRRCYCGCTGKASHGGAANGVALVAGCELAMRRWVKTGEYRTQEELERIARKRGGVR
ncbi:hypothetical protein [Nocardia sp. NPDC004260]